MQGQSISAGDPNILLRFLTENTPERSATKTCNDRLFNILEMNLSKPAPKETWNTSPLVGGSRAVLTVIGRDHVWAMSTAAVQLSSGMFESWVTRADEINEVARHPAFRV